MADPAYRFVERHLPKKLHFLIERYSEDATTESATAQLWRSVLVRYMWRVMLYAAILITICLISTRWLLPLLTGFSAGWGAFCVRPSP